MTETLRLFVHSDGPDSQQVDAAPGLEPPPPPPPPEPSLMVVDEPEIWEATLLGSYWDVTSWSTDLPTLEEWAKRRGLQVGRHVSIFKLAPRLRDKFRISRREEVFRRETTARDFLVVVLELPRNIEKRLLDNNFLRLGQIADMSWTDCKRIGLTPDDCRMIWKALTKYGLSLSFELFSRERRGWSKKRLSA